MFFLWVGFFFGGVFHSGVFVCFSLLLWGFGWGFWFGICCFVFVLTGNFYKHTYSCLLDALPPCWKKKKQSGIWNAQKPQDPYDSFLLTDEKANSVILFSTAAC